MKKILIIGKNSYIGTNFEKYINQYGKNEYSINKISVRDEKWKKMNFGSFDVILHLAAIVHQTQQKYNYGLFEKINHLLPVEIAKKAKSDGVKQFIFLSTMGVYGKEDRVISAGIKPDPQTLYAKSKFNAELDLNMIADEKFIISIVRPPMVYGEKCKGNYNKLSMFSKMVPFFPNINNKRSMIFIDNLSSFLKYIIDNPAKRVFFPQNSEYVNTFDLVKNIRYLQNMKIIELKGFNNCIEFLAKRFDLFAKVFGSYYYDDSLEYVDKRIYNIVNFEESVKLTEFKIK